MGKFTNWVQARLDDIREGVEDSVRFVHKAFKVTATDAQVDAVADKALIVVDDVERILVDLIDDIPGVPRIAAKLLAAQLGAGLQMAIAAAAEGARTANGEE